jgi:hypothetical protein
MATLRTLVVTLRSTGGQHEVRGWGHAYRLHVEQAQRARHKCRQGPTQGTPSAESLLWAGWVLVCTTLAPAVLAAQTIMALYRCRWQVEIYQSCNLRRTLFWPKFDSLRRHTAQRAVCDGEARRHMPWGWPPMIEPTPCLTEIPA